MNILRKAKTEVGADYVSKVKWLFENLGLPIPEEGEYIFTEDLYGPRFLVLATRYATAIKIDKFHPELSHEHPLILKPAKAFSFTSAHRRYDIEILPGIKIGLEQEDQNFLEQELSQDGLFYFDNKDAGNDGYFIGCKTTRFPRGIPVLLDRKAANHFNVAGYEPLKTLRTPLDPERQVTHPDEYAFAQDHLIMALNHRFNQAWPNFEVKANPHLMRAYWDMCHNLSNPKEGSAQMLAGWAKENQPKYNLKFIKPSKATEAALKYEEHLERVLGRVRA